MKPIDACDHFKRLKETYFSDPSQILRLKKGEALMEQGGFNDRLFLMLRGQCAGYVTNPQGEAQKLYTVGPDMFVGVYSFFSKAFRSNALVRAEEESELAFIDQFQTVRPGPTGGSLFEQFMPMIMRNLATRQHREQEIFFEKEHALRKLIHTEKMASLGQMAAGLAHELNNAITVLERNTQWIGAQIDEMIQQERPDTYASYQKGIHQGRMLSSRETRKRIKALMEARGLDRDVARMMTEAGLEQELTGCQTPEMETCVKSQHRLWELGATFHDMTIAALHASYVVKSVRALAARGGSARMAVNINETIQDALALLTSPLRKVKLHLSLQEIPLVEGNKGELVQVWTNLVKNAIDSMDALAEDDRHLHVTSEKMGAVVRVRVRDSGPGIPPEIMPKIRQPNFTTKEKGLAFGLGLGLSIVDRILSYYQARMDVESVPGKTCFTVQFPVGEHEEQNHASVY